MDRHMKNFAAVAAFALLFLVPTAQADSDLSPEATELMQLYHELHAFKDDEQFHQVGFGVCCDYKAWLQKIDDLVQRAGVSVVHEVGILPGELRQLGMDYMRSKGEPTSYTEAMEANVKAGLGE